VRNQILPGTGRGTAREGRGGGADSKFVPAPPPGFAWSPSPCRGGSKESGQRPLQQVLEIEAEAADLRGDGGPAVVEEIVAFGGPQALGGAVGDEHADPALHHHKPFVLEGLIGLCDGQRIGAMLGGEASHRRQRIAVADPAVENQGRDGIAEAEVDGTIFGHSDVV